MITNMAIVVVAPAGHASSPSQQTAPNQSQCKYSVQINSSPYTYQCYTEEEYQQKLAADAADEKRQEQAVENLFFAWLPNWMVHNWWRVLLGALGGFTALVVLALVADSIERKRHPERFDRYGFRLFDDDPWRNW